MTTIQVPMIPNHSPLSATTESNVIKRMKLLSKLIFYGAALLIIFGVCAILMWSYYSFYATPIWTAVAIYAPTGIVGLLAAKGKKRSPTLAFLALSLLCCVTSVMLIGLHIAAGAKEGWECAPSAYYYFDWMYDFKACASVGARQTIDSFIIIVSVYLLFVNIFSLAFGVMFARTTTTSGDACSLWVAQVCCCQPSHYPGIIMGEQQILRQDIQGNDYTTGPVNGTNHASLTKQTEVSATYPASVQSVGLMTAGRTEPILQPVNSFVYTNLEVPTSCQM